MTWCWDAGNAKHPGQLNLAALIKALWCLTSLVPSTTRKALTY